MTLTKNICGAWIISDIINGYIVTRAYYGYTSQEAVTRWHEELQRDTQ